MGLMSIYFRKKGLIKPMLLLQQSMGLSIILLFHLIKMSLLRYLMELLTFLSTSCLKKKMAMCFSNSAAKGHLQMRLLLLREQPIYFPVLRMLN